MAVILQTAFLSAFSSMTMHEFWLKVHWSLFLTVQLTIFQHWFRWWLGAYQATSHYLNQWWLDYRQIYRPRWGLNKMAAIVLLTCSTAFSGKQKSLYWWKFQRGIYLNNTDSFLWCINTPPGLCWKQQKAEGRITHCGLVVPHGGINIWVNIGSGNGLLPDGIKPLLKPMLTYRQWS